RNDRQRGVDKLTIRILSFDISASPGVALLEIRDGKPKLLTVDHVVTASDFTDAQRFVYIQSFVTQFVHEAGHIDAIVREKFIRGGSKRSSQLVFGAWASVDRALATYGYEIDEKDEIVASRVKKYIGGKGGAKKDEVADGVIRMIGEDVRPLLFTERGKLLDDRADAIAIGLAWAIENKLIKEAE